MKSEFWILLEYVPPDLFAPDTSKAVGGPDSRGSDLYFSQGGKTFLNNPNIFLSG